MRTESLMRAGLEGRRTLRHLWQVSTPSRGPRLQTLAEDISWMAELGIKVVL
jgi:hypothetical protein